MVIAYIIAIVGIIIIITIVVSVIAEAENRSNTRAYHIELDKTTKAPLSIPCGLITDEAQSMTAIRRFCRTN